MTERSFDGYMWQTVERKQRFIAQVMRGRLDVREIEDIGDAALSYNEVKALATGNPLLMEMAEAEAELTRLERAERAWNRNLDALAHKVTANNDRAAELQMKATEIDAAIGRRRDTRGDAFSMTAANTRYTRRTDAGEHLKAAITELDQALTRSGHKRLCEPVGELGGFPVLVTVERVLGTATIIIELQGAPGSEVRMSLNEVASHDSGKLIVRLEGRLSGLETLKSKTLAEIDRLTTEADHARDDLHKPFAHHGKLAEARDRAQRIAAQLNRAAEPARPGSGHATPPEPEWVRDALRDPNDPRWLAAAAAGAPGSAVAVITHPETDSQATPGRVSQPLPRGPLPHA